MGFTSGARGVVGELHRVVGGKPCIGVAGVIDAGGIGLAVDRIVRVSDGEIIPLGVGYLVHRPGARRGLAHRQQLRIGGVAELQDLARFEMHFEPCRPVAGRAMGDNLAEALGFGAVGAGIGAIGAADKCQPHAAQTKPVVGSRN